MTRMKIVNNLSIWLIVTIAVTNAANDESKEKVPCTKTNKQKLDDDVALLFTLGQHGRNFPENLQALEEYCSQSRILTQRADNYKISCSKGTTKELTSVILYSIRKVIKQICGKRKSPSKRKYFEELYRASKCANRFTIPLGNCLNVYIDKLSIIKSKPNGAKKLIPFTCCHYYELLRCFENVYEKNPECLPDRDFFMNFVRSIFDDIINVACGDYVENSNKCETLPKLPEIDVSKQRSKSVITPLIEVWDITE